MRRRAERKQFKLDRARAIATVAEEAENLFATEGRVVVPALSGPAIPSAATWRPSQSLASDEPPTDFSSGQVNDDEPLKDIEHLQLTLQEAFFLAWTIDCLTVLDPHTVSVAAVGGACRTQPPQGTSMSLQEIWQAFQHVHYPPCSTRDRLDNPFLIYYVAYHHYRSLGWVVKGGIKFCVDYLLYKRGPVFSHAE